MESINSHLQKYLSGKSSSEETQIVEKWIKANPKEFEHLQQIWQTPTSVPFQDVDVSQAMLNVEKEINTTSPKSKRNVRLLIKRTVAAAAVITVLISSSLLIQNQNQKKMQSVSNLEIVQDLELSDGTQISLNKGSSLLYPKSFSRGYRYVELLSGNAFFEVSKDPNKPFVIHTPHGQVKVLGTSFNVYVGEDKTQVYVKTGKVELENEQTNEKIQLLPEKAGSILPAGIIMLKDVSKNFLSWKTDCLKFENAGLKEIMESLERHYQCPVRFATANYPPIQFNGVFEAPQLSEILEVIGITCHLEYKILNKEILLSQIQ